jgi:hypothetical protein
LEVFLRTKVTKPLLGAVGHIVENGGAVARSEKMLAEDAAEISEATRD